MAEELAAAAAAANEKVNSDDLLAKVTAALKPTV